VPKPKELAQIVKALEADLRGPHIAPEHRDRVQAVAEDIRLEIALRQSLKPLPDGTPSFQPIDSAPVVVFFHVDCGDVHPMGDLVGDADQIDYHQALSLAVQSLRQTNPDAAVVVLTDTNTKIDLESVTIVREPVDLNRIMYSRMVAQRNFATKARSPLIFLDTDVLLMDRIGIAMDGSFDIGLTYRPDLQFTLMPVNGGVILASSPGAAEHFFNACLALYDRVAGMPAVRQRYDFDIGHWCGDQLSIAAFVDWDVPPEGKQLRLIDNLRVRFFPCETHNYTPTAADDAQTVQGKWAIHFKGPRKKYAAQFISRDG
jgi:hypothetical protein